MRAPMSWVREHVALPVTVPAREVADRLTAAGLQVERVEEMGAQISNVVVARVLELTELDGFGKPIRWVTVTDGTAQRQVICGATNFAVGDIVAYARPPATLPGGFAITARKTYGHVSDGMLCAGDELGISDDHEGILILDPDLPLGGDVVAALGLRDDVLDISINPDRGYALSIRGVAREVASAFGVAFTDPVAAHAVAAVETAGSEGPTYPVRIDAVAACDRYVARGLSGVDGTASSPLWLQRRLVLAGMRPISLVVDVTNHVMLELGQPLHAFDRSTLAGSIVVRYATTGERLVTLDGTTRELAVSDLVIADDSGPIALAGVMGGASTEIGASTTDVLIESAHFEATGIAVAARRHRLPSEASRRFERGVDHDLGPAAAQAAVSMLAALGGARPQAGQTDVDRRDTTTPIALDPTLPGRIAGLGYDLDAVEGSLTAVGCEVDRAATPWQVQPPSWRPDLRLPVDLVEEVMRLQGYADLPSTIPTAPAGLGLTRDQRLRRTAGRALAGAGHVEVLPWPFTAPDVASRMLLAPEDPRTPTVRLANPVSDDEPLLRASLLPGLFATLTRNVGRGATDLALYEIGSVFHASAAAQRVVLPAGQRPSPASLAALDASIPAQPRNVAVVLTGDRLRAGWWGQGRHADWSDAVASVRTLAESLGVQVEVSADQESPFHPGRCARIALAGATIGHCGELHPRVVEAFDLPPRTVAAELSFDALVAAAPASPPGPQVSAYPAAVVDVALVVPSGVVQSDVAAALSAGAGGLLESLRLFDVYVGGQVSAGSRSLAYRLHLRAPDRTLSGEEVTAARDAAIAMAAERCGAVLRQ